MRFNIKVLSLFLAIILTIVFLSCQSEIGKRVTIKNYKPSYRLIDEGVFDEMSYSNFPGCVILIGSLKGVVFKQAYGFKSLYPEIQYASVDSIYDLASLTKVIATTTAVMILLDEGKIDIDDPVTMYLPQFKDSEEALRRLEEKKHRTKRKRHRTKKKKKKISIPLSKTGEPIIPLLNLEGIVKKLEEEKEKVDEKPYYKKSEVLVRHLMTHTSGLPPGDDFYNRYKKTSKENRKQYILNDICRMDLRSRAGYRFKYSDLGFILLQMIVERLSKKSFDVFCHEKIFVPLKMNDTGFNPPNNKQSRIVPTHRTTSGRVLLGTVHDSNARVMNGVAGHAGLFSTVDDLAIFSEMLLNKGSYNGVKILKESTVELMTDVHSKRLRAKRGLGWDINTWYSKDLKTKYFSKESFGHTGFTGTSIWIDPVNKVYFIILANRVHLPKKTTMGPLRFFVSNVTGRLFEGKIL